MKQSGICQANTGRTLPGDEDLKERMISRLAAMLAVMICASACGSTSAGNVTSAAETAVSETEIKTAAETVTESTETDAETTGAVSETEEQETKPVPVDLSDGITDEMYERGLLSVGDTARLCKAFMKGESGQPITIGVIGGSITQGTAASSPANAYPSVYCKWWEEKFPESEITLVNAGIGGTDSYLGVNRVDEQLLAYDPDIVIVEFSVNDTNAATNKYSYDSLVRKILLHKSEPAVILLFMTQENGTSLQNVHREIGEAYDLPMLSWRDAVYPEVTAGTLDWKDISPDNIHPNDNGHILTGRFIGRYTEEIYDSLTENGALPEPADTSFTAPPLTKDYYSDAKMYYPSTLDTEGEGFETGSNRVYPGMFPENWVTDSGGTLRFEADCRTLGFFYLKTTDGKGGRYIVYVDGERRGSIDSDFRGGWGNYGATASVFIEDETKHHTVELVPYDGDENSSMTILGIMMS